MARLTLKGFTMKFSRLLAALAVATAFSVSAFAAGELRCPPPEKMKAHQEKLRDMLKLSPAQEAAWAKFTATLAAAPCQAKTHLDAAGENLTAPERVERMAQHHADLQAQLSKHAAALKEFYSTLTPEQKARLDQRLDKVRSHMGPPGEAPHRAGRERADHVHGD